MKAETAPVSLSRHSLDLWHDDHRSFTRITSCWSFSLWMQV